MIEAHMPDGSILQIADGTPPEKIAEIVGPNRVEVDMRNGSTAVFTADASADAIMAVTGPVKLAGPPADENSPRAEDASAQPFDWRPPRVGPVTPFVEDDEFAAMIARQPEVVREILRRSRLPAARAAEPSADVFKDNWHRNWSRRVWCP
jgi:hypothetical protein